MPGSEHCGLYIHVPFCKHRCTYCAFVSYPFDSDIVGKYIEAVMREICLWSTFSGEPKIKISAMTFDSIYLGGGTPSLLQVSQIEQLLDTCFRRFSIVPLPEITVEVNPDWCPRQWLKGIFDLGINRLSLGVQSFSEDELRSLGRSHDVASVFRSYADIRAVGFSNVSIDLMAGFPGHCLSSFEQSLEAAADLSPEHISVYLFELKEGTTIHRRILSGEDAVPDDDLAADLYELCCAFLTSERYKQYEISNFSKEGFECRHNLGYWMDLDYLGVGAGAHGLIGACRYANSSSLENYLADISQGKTAVSVKNFLSGFDRFRDALIMGARLVKGVDLGMLGIKYGVDADGFVRETLAELEDRGLFELKDNIFRLTDKGRLLSNQLFSRWV